MGQMMFEEASEECERGSWGDRGTDSRVTGEEGRTLECQERWWGRRQWECVSLEHHTTVGLERCLFRGQQRQELRMDVEQPGLQEGAQEVICKIQKRKNHHHRRVLVRQLKGINYQIKVLT